MTNEKPKWFEWLATTSQRVQDFAATHPEFSPGTVLLFSEKDEPMYFLGFSEGESDIGVLVSSIDPAKDYDTAIENLELVCGSHFVT